MKADTLAKEHKVPHATQRHGIESAGFADLRPGSALQRKLMEVAQRAGADPEEEKPAQLAALEEEDKPAQLAAQEEEEDKPAQLAAVEEEDKAPAQAKAIAAHSHKGGAGGGARMGGGLPAQLKAGIEAMSGMSMDHVKVHYNSGKPAQLQAHAYAQGSDIHLAPGQEHQLPHEAWHVVQQAQGRVQPTMQMKAGVPVNDDAGLEHEADVMGARAMQTSQLAAKALGGGHAGQMGAGIVQRSHVTDAAAEFQRHTNEFTNVDKQFQKEKTAIAPHAGGDSLAASGLKHWATETRRAAARHYNELYSVTTRGGIGKDVYLGASNNDDPDVYVKDGKGLLEVKTNDTTDSAAVDKLVFAAFNQLIGRDDGTGPTYAVDLYLENPGCVWPYTPSQGGQVFTPTAIASAMAQRAIHVTGNKHKVTIRIWYAHNNIKYVTVPYALS